MFPKKLELSEILKEHSNYNRTHLKQRLFKEGLLQNKCYECGQLPEWNGKFLVLQLDHINGITTDNRLENLRILCPNCHTQTETFGAKRFRLPDNFCGCGIKILKKSTMCNKCWMDKLNLPKPKP